jgi:hypothetical protein
LRLLTHSVAAPADSERVALSASIRGRLDVEGGCLVIRAPGRSGVVPVWPADARLFQRADGKYVVVSSSLRAQVIVGTAVRAGGGQATPAVIAALGPGASKCPGSLFILSSLSRG